MTMPTKICIEMQKDLGVSSIIPRLMGKTSEF